MGNCWSSKLDSSDVVEDHIKGETDLRNSDNLNGNIILAENNIDMNINTNKIGNINNLKSKKTVNTHSLSDDTPKNNNYKVNNYSNFMEQGYRATDNKQKKKNSMDYQINSPRSIGSHLDKEFNIEELNNSRFNHAEKLQIHTEMSLPVRQEFDDSIIMNVRVFVI